MDRACGGSWLTYAADQWAFLLETVDGFLMFFLAMLGCRGMYANAEDEVSGSVEADYG